MRLPQANTCFNKSPWNCHMHNKATGRMAGTETSELLNWDDGHASDTVDGDDF